MVASMLSACKLSVRAVCASLSLVVLLCFYGNLVQAQSLKFAPVIYNVQSVNGAQAVAMNGPTGVAVDGLGNLYILDSGHGQVRKVDATGTAVIYAGTGGSGLFGNNGPAIQATLYSPSAIAADAAGNLFIADTYNFAVRRIDATTGIISIIAGGNGSGTSIANGPASAAQFSFLSGIAVDTAGNVYVSDATTLVVRRIDTTGTITTIAGDGTPASGNGDGGVATSALLNAPYGLAVDSSNHLYIADYGASNVRVVDLTNNLISTFAGTGTRAITGDGGLATAAQLNSPRGVALDGVGNVYIADAYGNVRVVNSSNIISTLAGNNGGSSVVGDGTLPTQALIPSIYGVAADSNGNVYFPSQSTNKVYKVVTHPERFPMTTIGASSPSQRLIIQNTGNTDITYTSLTASGDFAFAASPNSYLSDSSPCSHTAGTYTISSGFNNYCEMDVVFTPTAAGIRSFALTMTSNDTPTTLTENLTSTGMGSALASTGGLIYTIGGQFGLTGVYGDGGQATASSLVSPYALVTDSAGDVFFTESAFCRVRKIDATTGVLTTIAGINPLTCGTNNTAYNQPDGAADQAELYAPLGLAIDTGGSLYVADSGHSQIRRITGNTITRIVGTGANGCSFAGNNGLAINAQICGPTELVVATNGDIYFTESTAGLIRKVTASTGNISIIAGMYPGTGNFTTGYSADGTGTSMLLNVPWGIALDSTQQNLYFSEFGNAIVRKLNLTTGAVTTVAGKAQTTGYTGDGGLATGSKLNAPHEVALDAANNIYVADSGNNLVRKIDGSTGIITTVAGNYVVNDLYNGEGIPATAAGLNYPENVTVDSQGYLILAERSPLIRQVSPDGSLNFGSQLINTTTGTQTVTISNIGNTPMTFSSPAYGISGDFAYAAGGSCTFTGSLAVGDSCTVKLTFTPTAVGERYGVLAYYDNGVASPQQTQLSGVGTAPAQAASQSITLTNPGTMTYGASAFSPVATATSGLPVTITVQSGPASITAGVLTITGAGTVTLAANQAGNSSYSAAPQVTATFNVLKASLTVTPITIPVGYGSTIPSSFATNITGYVNNDTSAAVSGSATVTTNATSSSPVGPYTLTATIGTLTSTNYSFTFAPGTLNITIGSQTITISPISGKTYGNASFAVTASATSGLPVTLSIKSGNATINSGMLTLTGIGTVVVQADQAGNTNYSPASTVTQNFNVSPATLTVTANAASMVYGAASLPTFSGVISGYVYSDTSSVVSGIATYSTSASSTSAPNAYQITPNVSGLIATNYTFTAAPGSLTVTQAPLTIAPNAVSRSYGVANPTFTGTPTGLKNGDNPTILYSTTALATSAPGTYPITAAISGTGSANYAVTLTPANLTVTKANTTTTLSVTQILDVENTDTLTAVVAPISASGTPTGTVTFYDNNGVNPIGTGNYIAGTGYVLTTSNFTGGVHSITATYSGDTNFFGSTTANASISTVGDYSFSANPSTLAITAGSSGTTTITFTPTFGWTGTQTLSCTGLHAGMTCSFSPASLTSNGNNAPVTTVLTISTTSAHALGGVTASNLGGGPVSLLALLVLLPVAYASRKRRGLYRLTMLLLITVAMLLPMGCGSPAVNPNATPAGADPVAVTFPGADAAHQLNLTITVN